MATTLLAIKKALRQNLTLVVYLILVAVSTYNWNRASDMTTNCRFSQIEQSIFHYSSETQLMIAQIRTKEVMNKEELIKYDSSKIDNSIEASLKSWEEELEELNSMRGELDEICSSGEQLAWQSLVMVILAGGILTFVTSRKQSESTPKAFKPSRKRILRARLVGNRRPYYSKKM